MNRNKLLSNICPTDITFNCWKGDKSCTCKDCNRELGKWLDEYDKQIRSKFIEEVNQKLDELERNCESCYGAKIVEMYADTYEMFRKWLEEQDK